MHTEPYTKVKTEGQELNPGWEMDGHSAAMPRTQKQVAAARNFVGWIRWYMRLHPADVPTQAALAKRLHVTEGAITPLLRQDPPRMPSFETLLAAKEMTGLPLDQLVFSPYPEK